MSDSSSFFNIYRAAEKHESKNQLWFVRLIQAIAWLLLMTLLTDVGIVMFWPDGLNLLKSTYHQEVQYLSHNIDDVTTQRIATWTNTAYDWVFVKTGVQGYLYSGHNRIANGLISGFWSVLQGVMIGFQVFMIRLCVIVLMLPFILMVMIVAASDGYLEWYRRRTGGARESAFIYHRAKHMLNWSLIGFWFLYLVPPFAINPVYIFLPSVIFLGIFARLSIQYFKKYI